MKGSVQALAVVASPERSWAAVWCDLVKARLTALVLITTLVGFYMGIGDILDWARLLHTLLGTGLLACGAAALNQFVEREHDAKMRRTENRPLPSGRLQPETVRVFGMSASILGLGWLASMVTPVAAAVGAVTVATYLFLYTPLKRVTWMNTLVGAVPGGLPPLLGWTAARGEPGPGGWALFAILFLWQVPHFLAIAWLYRDDYARGGFVMLPSVDAGGTRTGRHAVAFACGLLIASVGPCLLGLAGAHYLGGAVLLGAIFVWAALRFARGLTLTQARMLFLISILYLPALLGLLVWDKVKG
jgi:heme o synthase